MSKDTKASANQVRAGEKSHTGKQPSSKPASQTSKYETGKKK